MEKSWKTQTKMLGWETGSLDMVIFQGGLVYPVIHKGFLISEVAWEWDFWTINSSPGPNGGKWTMNRRAPSIDTSRVWVDRFVWQADTSKILSWDRNIRHFATSLERKFWMMIISSFQDRTRSSHSSHTNDIWLQLTNQKALPSDDLSTCDRFIAGKHGFLWARYSHLISAMRETLVS